MGLDYSFVCANSSGLDRTKVILNPFIKPFSNSHFTRDNIITPIKTVQCILQFLRNDLFGFIGDAALDLLSGPGVKAFGVSGFVVGVLFAFYYLGDFTN